MQSVPGRGRFFKNLHRKMKDLVEIIKVRACFYQFLSPFFLREVSLEHLEILSSMKVPPHSRDRVFLKGLIPPKGKSREAIKEELDVDYGHIFLGLGPRAAFPYESVYRHQSRLLMQEPYDEVRTFYEKTGFRKNPNLLAPEDHIGIELAFMATLCHRTAIALEESNLKGALLHLENQKAFLQSHLGSWIPSFCEEMQGIAQTEFYRSLAKLLNTWIFSDQEELRRVIDSLKPGC